jgi:hypothetical protein
VSGDDGGGPGNGGSDGHATDCTSTECGPAPQLAPALACSDGTTAGPICSRYASGKCAWSITSCPGSISCQGEACGPAPPGDTCSGLGNYGVCLTDGRNGCNWQVTCFDLPPPG